MFKNDELWDADDSDDSILLELASAVEKGGNVCRIRDEVRLSWYIYDPILI